MGEEQTNFKVTDRRLFNSDGSPRDVPPEEKPPVEPEKETPAAVAETPLPESTAPAVPPPVDASEIRQDLKQEEAADLAGPDADLPGVDEPASFANFIMSIASNAASSLGMMEHPVTGKREVDLELGKHWIDVLGMLHEKTRGNLLPQEQQVLESLLADLRMQYVSLTSATTPKPQAYSSRDITGG